MEKRKTRILGLAVAAAVIFGPGCFYLLQMAWQQHQLDRQTRDLERIRQRLVEEQERLVSDPVYVEGLIRSTFKLAKPGELVVLGDPQEPDGPFQ